MQRHKVRIRGPHACFTQLGLGTERVSYAVITPPAARTILSAIYGHPGMTWLIHSITVLNPIRYLGLMRNEVKDGIINPNSKNIKPYYIGDAAQRNSLILKNVDYVIEASIVMTDQKSPSDNLAKFNAIFTRRLEKGQNYYPPYLGQREFLADVFPAIGDEQPLNEDLEIGWMVKNYRLDHPKRRPVMFQANMRNGIIKVDWQ